MYSEVYIYTYQEYYNSFLPPFSPFIPPSWTIQSKSQISDFSLPQEEATYMEKQKGKIQFIGIGGIGVSSWVSLIQV